jgi:hypothetical protein
MSRELVKIPASVLRAGKPFARAIYLRMPKNQKMLRLVESGDEIRPALLARLLNSPSAELFAQPLETDPHDGLALDLYGEEAATAAATSSPSLSAMEPEPAGKNSFETLPDASEEEPEAVFKAGNSSEPEENLGADAKDPEENSTVAAGSAGLEIDTHITGGENITEARRRRKAGLDAEAEARFGADEAIAEDETAFGKDVPAAAEETFLASNLSEAVENFAVPARQRREEETSLGRLLGLAAEGFAAFATDKEGATEETRGDLVAALSEAFSEVARLESNGSEIPHVLRALRDSLGRVSDAVTRGDTALPANADLPALSEHLSGFVEEFKATVERPAEEASFERRLEQVAEEFTLFSEQGSSNDNATELLRDKLGTCVAEIDARVAVGAGTSSDLLTVKESLQRAIASLPFTSRGAKAYRETPQIAARMASLLAHSLGYASPLYLYDVAFTAHLFFAEKNGAPLSPTELSPMAEALLAEELPADQAGTPMGDSAAILRFLDLYFDNPDCDRTQKEFGKRAFESTLSGSAASTNEWTAARWRYFVEQGPSLSALSASSKAAAKANKAARGLAGEPPVV